MPVSAAGPTLTSRQKLFLSFLFSRDEGYLPAGPGRAQAGQLRTLDSLQRHGLALRRRGRWHLSQRGRDLKPPRTVRTHPDEPAWAARMLNANASEGAPSLAERSAP